MSKVLIIDTDNVGLSLAWRSAQAGHEVKWFVKPKKCNNPDTGRGFKGITKVENFVPHMMWADLVICTSNDDYLDRLDFFKKKGAKVFAPTVKSANLEISRKAGMEMMEKVGIETAPYKTFKRMEDAEAHVKKTEERFVFKTLGDNEDKALTYVSKNAADLMEWMKRIRKSGSEPKGDVMLQTFIKGIEMGVSRFMGKDGFVGQWNESFEHKKLMSGNHGCNCYPADSEVLTSNGWKFWPDVLPTDEVCTLREGKIEYEVPSRMVNEDFDGTLIGWESNTVDILVTPGHRMYVQDDYSRKPFFFEPADVTVQHSRNITRGGGEWVGINALYHLPAFYTGGLVAWAALLGMYIADGSLKARSLQFGNCPAHKQIVFTKIAKAAGYSAKMYGKDLYVNSRDLAVHFAQFGKAADKYVPDYIKNATPDVIESFLYGYGAGDGTTRANNLSYSTISRRLADDIQELLLKVGRTGGILIRDRRGESHNVNGYDCINQHIGFDIGVSNKVKASITPEISYLQPYAGRVYCCEVTSHIIFVRRNGRACWLGQTGEMGTIAAFSKESKLGTETLAKLENELVELGHLGDTAIGFIIDEIGKPYPTEFTMRFGWPIENMMLAATKGDPIQWMIDAREGKDTTSFSENIGCCLVLTHGDFPYGNHTREEVSNVPIYGVTKGNKKYLHPQAVKIDMMMDMDGDKVVERPLWNTAGDYIAVVTGFGKDIKQAADRAYKTTKQLHVSNMMVRDDIGEELEKQLPELQKFGFATHFNYESKGVKA